MAFVIRTISHSAAGREIQRIRRVEADHISIGRDPASDVHLPDLDVTRHHAQLRIEPNGLIHVDATDGVPIEVDGTFSDQTTIDRSTGSEILLGGFRLVIAAGEMANDVAVVVERRPRLAKVPKDERRRFSLDGVITGKRTMAWTLAIGILIAFLAWPIWSFHAQAGSRLTAAQIAGGSGHSNADAAWSTGRLSLPHAGLEGNCTACHRAAFVAVPDAACRACHTTVHDHADPARLAAARTAPNLSGSFRLAAARLFGKPDGRCADCHQEHLGAVAAAPTPQRFCSDCHSDLKTRLPDTKLGNAADFASAHPQFSPAFPIRSGDRTEIIRLSLDKHPLQETGLKFPHALHLASGNAVARMAQTLGSASQGNGLACVSCHVPDQMGSFRAVSMEANCQSCHSLAFARADGVTRTLSHGDPRQVVGEMRDFFTAHGPSTGAIGDARRRPGDFAAIDRRALYGEAVATRGAQGVQAIRALFSRGGACADCHFIRPAPAGTLDYGVTPVTMPTHFYERSVFDHRVHASESCASCHGAASSMSARDILLPKIGQCRQCHGGETVAQRGQVPSSCALCHGFHQNAPGPDDAPFRRKGPPAFERLADARRSERHLIN